MTKSARTDFGWCALVLGIATMLGMWADPPWEFENTSGCMSSIPTVHVYFGHAPLAVLIEPQTYSEFARAYDKRWYQLADGCLLAGILIYLFFRWRQQRFIEALAWSAWIFSLFWWFAAPEPYFPYWSPVFWHIQNMQINDWIKIQPDFWTSLLMHLWYIATDETQMARIPVSVEFLVFGIVLKILAAYWKSPPPRFPRCQSCDYDLRGSTSPACPECGEPRTPPTPVTLIP